MLLNDEVEHPFLLLFGSMKNERDDLRLYLVAAHAFDAGK